MSDSNPLWEATYTAKTPDELNAAYKDWAEDYDTDTLYGMGYVGPTVAGKLLNSYLESDASHILDAGCGTGLVGEVLDRMGFNRMDAMDYSPDMLAEAEKKEVYDRTFQADMNKRLDVSTDTYDAVICVGAFTYAHVGPHAFDELVRITKPGGYICFTVRDGAYQEYGYRKKMLDLEADSTWVLQQMLDEDYLLKEGVTAKFCTYRLPA